MDYLDNEHKAEWKGIAYAVNDVTACGHSQLGFLASVRARQLWTLLYQHSKHYTSNTDSWSLLSSKIQSYGLLCI